MDIPPLLMADMGNWIGLIILVLTVLGWIVNAIKGVDPQGNPLPNRKPVKKPQRDLRSEIEVFLEELQQPKPAAEARRPADPSPPRPPKRQVKDKPRKPPAPVKSGKSLAQQTKPPRTPQKLGQGLASRHLSDANLGGDINQSVQQHFQPAIDQSVKDHLSGGTVAPVEAAYRHVAEPHPLVALLQSPQGIQQAVIMGEILRRPRVLEKTSHR